MAQLTNVQAFKELFSLIDYYSENRDQPADPDFDFFEHVKNYCDQLDLDYEEFKQVFGLQQF
ncbi:hypothetical protein [Salimicrobium halophilum]|uniref:Uncharacterized protein n=1 Tax=Salimicrobium halophilum TaxID=86666 RepID=A0A1G8UGV7_9BACI|nr:hypothetical protein [Salimicrobium halophilum]SDJ53076.1 hypothetical protein SAMN04490247_2260 [Salimicrobium halophilum]